MVVTFVTSSNPKSVKHLDNRRLNKQRVEAQQILDTLLSNTIVKVDNKTKGWVNHPSVLMWTGHTDALKVYINCCIRQWLKRGKSCQLQPYLDVDEDIVEWPWWFTWPLLHLSHKCSLLRKDPGYYGSRFVLTTEETEWLQYGYVWPSKLQNIDITRTYAPSEVCVSIGAGAPAQYRWTIDEVSQWHKNRLVNPRTGRTISKDAKTGVYKDIEKAYKYYVSVGEL